MTAVTAAAVGGDLLDELRGLLDRHDTAATLDDVREIADELTGVLRRTRGRIGRLARKTEPRPAPKPAEKPESAPKPKPAPKPEAVAARPAVEPKRAPQVAEPRPVPALERPAVRRVTTLHLVLAILAVAWSVLAAGTVRVARALTGRRRCRAPAFALPRPGDAPPLAATRRSPLDVAAGLQVQKPRAYAAYQDTVLQWELGMRAYQGLKACE